MVLLGHQDWTTGNNMPYSMTAAVGTGTQTSGFFCGGSPGSNQLLHLNMMEQIGQLLSAIPFAAEDYLVG